MFWIIFTVPEFECTYGRSTKLRSAQYLSVPLPLGYLQCYTSNVSRSVFWALTVMRLDLQGILLLAIKSEEIFLLLTRDSTFLLRQHIDPNRNIPSPTWTLSSSTWPRTVKFTLFTFIYIFFHSKESAPDCEGSWIDSQSLLSLMRFL